jgi:hypothetical protein
MLIVLLWAVLAVVLLVVGLTSGEQRMGAQLLMMFLGFPSALLAQDFVLRWFPELGSHLFDVHGSLGQYIAESVALLCVGGLQWFVVPYLLWRQWKRWTGGFKNEPQHPHQP